MNKEELLAVRYKVIAPCPFSKFVVGEILTGHNHDVFDIKYEWYASSRYAQAINASDVGKYPHIFKRLIWWEDRTGSELPKYVKDKHIGTVVVRVHEYLPNTNFFVSEANEDNGYLSNLNMFLPADLSDYTDYINSPINK